MTFSLNPFNLLQSEDEPQPTQPTQPQQQQQAVEQKKEVNQKEQQPLKHRQHQRPQKSHPKQDPEAGIVEESVPGKKREGQRPRRGGRGGWHGKGRQLDRHSGRHPDSEKKVHQGWGDATQDTPPAESTEEPIVEGEIVPEVREEEPVVKTLDEYLAERAEKKLSLGLPAVRKPNEGNEEQWKNAVPLKREESDDFMPKKNMTVKKKEKDGKVKPQPQQVLTIEQRFFESARGTSRPQRGRGGRGGRGGERGRGRAAGGRAPNLNDPNAFPILA